jgi:transcriptional regulator with XRE-family HTH domain
MTFELQTLSENKQADFKADGRMRAYLSMKRAFKKRSKESGVTLQSLSKAIGRDKGQISKVLAGTAAGITLDTLVLITSALGFRVSFDVDPVENMKKRNRNVAPTPSPLVTLNKGQALQTASFYVGGSTGSINKLSYKLVIGHQK